MLTSSERNLSAIVGEPADFSVAVDVDKTQREQSSDALVIAVTDVLISVDFLTFVRRLRLHVHFFAVRHRSPVIIIAHFSTNAAP